jgi:predicted RNA-binding protein
MKYWINTVSRSHVEWGMQGGFTQSNHGRIINLRRLSKGDLIVFYSPRTEFRNGEQLQQFTALARVVDEVPYQVAMKPDFHPWRRKVNYLPCKTAPIKPLIEQLKFITDKQKWGFPFRQGLFEIPAEDFQRIVRNMNAEIEQEESTKV